MITISQMGSFQGDALRLEADIRSYGAELSNMREPFEIAINEVIIPSIDRNFRTGGRPPWAPLEASTISRRKTAVPILIRTGELHKMATNIDAWRISRNIAEMEIAGYGRFHQTGTRNMPQREFAVLQGADEQKIEEVFAEWVERAAGRHGWSGVTIL